MGIRQQVCGSKFDYLTDAYSNKDYDANALAGLVHSVSMLHLM